jgi:hypothetical protein
MGSLISGILLNKWTSTAGVGAIVAAATSIYHSWPNVDMTQAGIVFTGLVGLFGKDFNVSGTLK